MTLKAPKLPVDGKNFCARCQEWQPVSNFGKHKAMISGLQSWCRDCVRVYAKARAARYQAKYNDERRRRADLRAHPCEHCGTGKVPEKQRWCEVCRYRVAKLSKYRLTLGEWEAMAERQDHRCLICNKRKSLCVDHSHSTGVVRGLLCRSCNQGLGHYEDNPRLLRAAANYLKGAADAEVERDAQVLELFQADG